MNQNSNITAILFYPSYLRLKISECRIPSFLSQSAVLKVKKCETLTRFFRLAKWFDKRMAFVTLADASHSKKGSQLCYSLGLTNDKVYRRIPLLLKSWSSHLFRRQATSTPAVEVLAASDVVDKTIFSKKSSHGFS